MRFLFAGFLVLAACGGSNQGPNDPMKIEVPPQPPPIASAGPTPVAVPPSAPIAARPFTCNGGQLLQAFPGPHLCTHTDPKTWDDAEAQCVADGGHLLALESENDIDHAKMLLTSRLYRLGSLPGRASWIGLETADKKKRTWKWNDGEAVKAASWADGEPNNWDGNEQCGEWLFATGKWNDTRCNLEQPYLCEGVRSCPSKIVVSADKEYCWVPDEADYAKAKKGCAQLGGKLALPKTAEAQKLLTRGAAQSFPVKEFWIGLNELSNPGTWLWTTGAELGDSASWKPTEPNGYRGNEHCVEVYADSWWWNDFDCAEKLPFVCGPGPAKSR